MAYLHDYYETLQHNDLSSKVTNHHSAVIEIDDQGNDEGDVCPIAVLMYYVIVVGMAFGSDLCNDVPQSHHRTVPDIIYLCAQEIERQAALNHGK